MYDVLRKEKVDTLFPLRYNKYSNFKVPKREKEKNMKKVVSVVAVVMLVAMLAVCLVACAPKDMDTAKTKMSDAGYLAVGGTWGDKDANVKGLFVATKLTDSMVALYFDSASDAKAFIKENGSTVTFGGKEYKSAEQTGKWVIAGSDDAKAAFKK